MKIVVLVALALAFASSAFAKTVTLNWDASPTPEVTGYKLCYTANAGLLTEGQPLPTEGILPTCVDAGNVLTIVIEGLPDDQVHYIGAVAYDAVNQESVLSNIVMSHGFAVPQPAGNLRGFSTVNTVDVPVQ